MLADGTNLQVRASNKMLLALLISGFILNFPAISEIEHSKELMYSLPFSLGSLQQEEFYLFSIYLQSVITLVFCQSYIGMMETAKLAHSRMRGAHKEPEEILSLYNIMVASGITKISFLTNSLIKSDNILMRLIGLSYYCILYLITAVLVCVLPTGFLIIFEQRIRALDDVPFFYTLFSLILFISALIALILVAVNLIRYFMIALSSWGFLKERFLN